MEPHERLSAAMNERRLDLGLQWRELSQGAGISDEALRAIRRGDYRPSELTARRLDDQLQWSRGTVMAVLDGRPVPDESGSEQGSRMSEEEFERLIEEAKRARREELERFLRSGSGQGESA